MIPRDGAFRARAVVAGVGLLLTLAVYLLTPTSLGTALLAATGLAGCLGTLLGRPAGTTLTGAAALGQVAIDRPSTAAVLVTAALLALLLAAAETADSRRWSASWRAPVRSHAAPACLGVALVAAGLLLEPAGRSAAVLATVVAVVGLIAATGGVVAIIVRTRTPR